MLIVILAGLSYLLAFRLLWVALTLGSSGRCEEAVVALNHRIVSATCHPLAAQVRDAHASWAIALALALLAFAAIGLGSGLLLWRLARSRRQASSS